MTSQKLAKLEIPDNPGVYIFRDKNKRPLYIGRATFLRDRVRSYFAKDIIAARGMRIVDMVGKAATVTWTETDSVLEAVLLESRLIKRYQPPYNVDERDDKSSQCVIVTDEEWPRVFLMRERDLERRQKERELDFRIRSRFGPFVESGLVIEALKILRRLFPFRDKKARDPRHEAFYRAIGISPQRDGAGARERYAENIGYLEMFFEGRKRELRARLMREMDEAVAAERFEDADRAKKLLYAIDHIRDTTLLKRGRNAAANSFRIEAYDVAHLSGLAAVGAMAVNEDGEAAPAQYRRFKLSRDRNDDIAGLVEILSRRLNHSEWTYPDLVAVDGDERHMRAAEAVLSARRLGIPVVAVTKDSGHKAARLSGNAELIKRFRREIIAANAEAHRFAISYHRRRRNHRII